MRSLIIVTLFLVSLSGCTARFIADFEADTAGNLPDTAPDGAPTDQISVLNIGSGNIAVIASNPIDDSQSLRLSGPASADSVSNKSVYMYAEAITSNDKRLYASWNGRVNSGAGVVIRFFSGHFATLVELTFESGNIIVAGGVIGTYSSNQVHSVFINVDPVTDAYSVSVLGEGSPSVVASGTIPNPSDLPTGNIGLSFNLISGGSTASYTIDRVRMSERNP